VAQLLSEFVQDVRARGPYTAAQNVAEDAVLRTAIDLCERAGVWQYKYQFTTQYNVPDYPIYTPENSRVVCLTHVQIGSRKFKPSVASLVCSCGSWGVSVPDNKTVMIHPAPMSPDGEYVELSLWLAPLLEACVLPDVLWQEYSDTIAIGAASRLLQMPKQDYTNQGLASRMYTMYEAGVTRAKNKRVLERTQGPLMMRGSFF